MLARSGVNAGVPVWLAASLLVSSLAPCSSYSPTFVSSLLRPGPGHIVVARMSSVSVWRARPGRIAARMSSVVQDGAGRLPPKPLAKYTTEPVGTNIPKADSGK